MNIEQILNIIREYQYTQECIMDYSTTVTDKSYIRSSIKYDAAEEIRGLFIRKYSEKRKV